MELFINLDCGRKGFAIPGTVGWIFFAIFA